MENTPKEFKSNKEEEEEGHARDKIWSYIFGFVEMAVVKCAIELKIADTIESHGSPMTLSQLTSTLNCSSPALNRIMRFLIYRGIFKEVITATEVETVTGYTQTPLSRLLASGGENSMAPLLLLESSPVMLAPWHCLSAHVKADNDIVPFEAAHGEDLWSYGAADPAHSKLFNEAMACAARVITVPAIIEGCREIFEGIGTLVDVGGGNGTCLSILVKGFPWIRGINFDLPHVVSGLTQSEGVQHVSGDMFDSVPKADAAFLMWVLHDWNDEECIKILKNCKEAIRKETGKVIIVEAVIGDEENKLADVGLMLDMVMMAHTRKGKERTAEEWGNVLMQAGFSKYKITPIQAVQSVIEGFP